MNLHCHISTRLCVTLVVPLCDRISTFTLLASLSYALIRLLEVVFSHLCGIFFSFAPRAVALGSLFSGEREIGTEGRKPTRAGKGRQRANGGDRG